MDEQLALPLEEVNNEAAAGIVEENTVVVQEAYTVSALFIAGSGSEAPELHVTISSGGVASIRVMPLSNPVTPKQIADIISQLN